MTNLVFDVSIIATAVNGVLTGASLDQSIKQLPARHIIGVIAFSKYSQAVDLRNGILWYSILGIGAALITVLAAALAFTTKMPLSHGFPIYTAAFFSILHSFATTQAAPINFSQQKVTANEKALVTIFNQFEKWQTIRAIFQICSLGACIWILISYS